MHINRYEKTPFFKTPNLKFKYFALCLHRYNINIYFYTTTFLYTKYILFNEIRVIYMYYFF